MKSRPPPHTHIHIHIHTLWSYKLFGERGLRMMRFLLRHLFASPRETSDKEGGSASACSKKSILNSCWWPLRTPRDSHCHRLPDLLAARIILTSNIWGNEPLTLHLNSPMRLIFCACSRSCRACLGLDLSSWPVNNHRSVCEEGGKSARPVQGQKLCAHRSWTV